MVWFGVCAMLCSVVCCGLACFELALAAVCIVVLRLECVCLLGGVLLCGVIVVCCLFCFVCVLV